MLDVKDQDVSGTIYEAIATNGTRVFWRGSFFEDTQASVDGKAYTTIGQVWLSLDGRNFRRGSLYRREILTGRNRYSYYLAKMSMGKKFRGRLEVSAKDREEVIRKLIDAFAGVDTTLLAQTCRLTSASRVFNLTGGKVCLKTVEGQFKILEAIEVDFDKAFTRVKENREVLSFRKDTLYNPPGKDRVNPTLEVVQERLIPTVYGREILSEKDSIILLSIRDFAVFLLSDLKKQAVARVIGCYHGMSLGIDALGNPLSLITVGIE